MKKTINRIFISALACGCVLSASAQSAVDALQLTQNDFKGTARFMSMGGAYTALGGDLSAIRINPGGIGVYRSSEISATLDVDFQKTKTFATQYNYTEKQTKAYCNNFGYVGTINLNGALKTFSWGVTYNREKSFDRLVSGYAYPIKASLTNYIAAFTQGVSSSEMNFASGYNPYQDSQIDWLSILGYSGYLINNINGSPTTYSGLFQDGTESDAQISVQEKGYIDNYQFTFGGNVNHIVYWGVGIGINDLRYVRNVYYSESMDNALVYADNQAGVTPGKAEYSLYNNKLVTGTGWNLSAGVIVKPIQELRIGASIISPTWYTLTESYNGAVESNLNPANTRFEPVSADEYTDEAYFNWKLRSPWRFNVGVAAVLGSKAIISADYEVKAYKDMTLQTASYDNWGYVMGYQNADWQNSDIKAYTENASNLRLGLEYRISPQVSARLGYNQQFSNINSAYREGHNEILTSGTDPSFSLDKSTSYVTAGLGFKLGNFFADLTYVHKSASSTLMPFTSYDQVEAPRFHVNENNNSAVLSLGFRF